MSDRKRYAIVGTGGRCVMFMDAILDTYHDQAELVGLCDLSQTRMDVWNRRLKTNHSDGPFPTYRADDFDQMIEQQKPDVVIVTTMDSEHHTYIIRAMELGCDVICEKPMTIDAEKAQAILDAQQHTRRKVTVTFNYRYMPGATLLRKTIMDGTIGTPLAVDFMWTLNTSHGADYFRRWHREKDKSGGLLVHKATHHFDLVNFWIASQPKTVYAQGELKFYGRENAAARGESYDYDRYTGEAQAKDDPFALDLTSDENLKELYHDAEGDSGYIRDRNVFGDNITIEDTMHVLAKYRNGVMLNYSLIAYSPWEGLRVAITGTKGRVEWFSQHGTHIITGQSDEELAEAQAVDHTEQLKVFPMFAKSYEIEIPVIQGAHGGGDQVILEQLFAANPPADPFDRGASHIDGAASILLGVAANESIRTGHPVEVDSLVALPV